MKIIVVGPLSSDSFARNIVVTLQRSGYEVRCVGANRGTHHQPRVKALFWNYAPKFCPALNTALYKELLVAVREFVPDLVLFTVGTVPPRIVDQLRKISNAKFACWYPDAIPNFSNSYLLGTSLDGLFVKEPFLVRVLREKFGTNVHYLPEACNSVWHRRVALSEEDRRKYTCEIAGMGTLHYYRARLFEGFVNYDVKIWGRSCPTWIDSATKKFYPNIFVGEETKARALLCSKIVVNTINYTEVEAVNCALFEIAGCGAFQIADWKPALPDLFEPQREIVTFRDRNELLEKVDYYLRNPEERQQIADRAYARAHKEHTYEKRLSRMFVTLGLTPLGESAANAREKGRDLVGCK